MSMITGCPACGTLFRVVPDQLKISEGWVRCGHCGEVFDASGSLRAEAAEPAPPAPLEPPAQDVVSPRSAPGLEAEGEGVSPVAPTPAAMPVEVGPPGIGPTEVPPAGVEPVAVAPLFVRAEAAPPAADSQFSASHGFADAEFGHDALTPDEEDALRPPAPAARPPAAGRAQPEPAPLSRPFAPTASQLLDDAYPEDLSFVREARRHAFWRRPAVRLSLLLAVLALAALLAAQYAVQERNRLAAQHPQLRPWLVRLCSPLGCTLAPPQRIESVVIDNSGFTRVRPDTYRLSVSLRNSADVPVAIPALQLTLTDSQEQPVVQRVFMPGELGAKSDSIAPASEFTASLVLAVNPGNAAGRIAGYRLLAFYP